MPGTFAANNDEVTVGYGGFARVVDSTEYRTKVEGLIG